MFMSDGDQDREASDRTAKDFVLASFDMAADGPRAMEDDNPYQSPGADITIGEDRQADDEGMFRRAKRKVLLAILLLFVLDGFLAPLTEGDAALRGGRNIVTAIALAALLLQWCQYDRREHAIKRWPCFGVMMIICPGPLILMPVYFLATRGWRGLISIMKASGMFAMAIVATLVGFAVSAAMFRGWEHLRH
jgi:hypothetical protein